MVIYLSTNRDITFEDPTKQRVQEYLDELLSFTDDPNLQKEGFLVLAVEQHGILKSLRPPLLQVMASAYGWFVEHIGEDDVAVRTMRNFVSQQDLQIAFFGFLENAKRPDNLRWRKE